jgi:hypothetical protein
MSIELLHHLNGKNSGLLDTFIKQVATRDPQICWYPSAGNDLRDLFFLSAAYQEHDPARIGGNVWNEPVPDLFLHTDYWPSEEAWFTAAPHAGTVLFEDEQTTVTILAIEQLPNLNLPLSPEIVVFPHGSALTGKVYFMEVEAVATGRTIKTHLLYAFVENLAFFRDVMLPCAAHVSHVIHNRFGGGFGGGRANGQWLTHVLDALQCDIFITDGRHEDAVEGDHAALSSLREIDSFELRCSTFFPGERIRSIPGHRWSGYGDTVDWLRRAPARRILREELLDFVNLRDDQFREPSSWRQISNVIIACSLKVSGAHYCPLCSLEGLGQAPADSLHALIRDVIDNDEMPEHLVQAFSLVVALDKIAPRWIDAEDLLWEISDALELRFGYTVDIDMSDPAAAIIKLLLHCIGLGFLGQNELADGANRETVIRALLLAMKYETIDMADILRLVLFFRSIGVSWKELDAIERSVRADLRM